LTEPWREEQASLDLEWRVFAQKHNAAGKRPKCYYTGMEADELDQTERVTLVDAKETDPNCLIDALAHDRDEQKIIERKRKGM
jgi:hypothetical protein